MIVNNFYALEMEMTEKTICGVTIYTAYSDWWTRQSKRQYSQHTLLFFLIAGDTFSVTIMWFDLSSKDCVMSVSLWLI